MAILSFFVYDYKIEPVLLCILYSFMSSSVSDRVLKSGRSAIRFEIITDYAAQISQEIITKLNHSATLVPGKGMYSGHETNILVCIINKTQIPVLGSIIRSYPNTFAVMNHSATLVPGKGMYSGHETNILVCIINKTQIPVLGSIIRSYPNTFAVMSSVTEVMGNFKHMNTDGTESNIFLDSGDGSEV